MRKYGMILLLAIFWSCGQPSDNKTSESKDTLAVERFDKEVLKMFPETADVDSLAILYFTDKVKFRYYTYYATGDKGIINALYKNLETVTVSPDTCTKDGTIYCYVKGNVYNSIYFNITDPCAYISMIGNGRLHRYKISEDLKAQLLDLKSKAVEPVAADAKNK
ncbi:hypothetical protein GFS24_21715 [Chitinophaga sp. SYP-B3965]|uniref:hypothetical protein n=1 Tax=Chitinophaga sp. SYP-B3965 TaxID=2663120 RepID=UPI001299B785|nr:hypothetical protein [Chitinophaga sp. SYP-B3965]MRG47756.1 hypothetical protein [Chitinophaga sp. SYP-B3965]